MCFCVRVYKKKWPSVRVFFPCFTLPSTSEENGLCDVCGLPSPRGKGHSDLVQLVSKVPTSVLGLGPETERERELLVVLYKGQMDYGSFHFSL